MNTIKTTYGVPALISFFIPGLGQLIKGQFLKAFIIWAIGGTLSFLLGWTIVVPFLIWAWNVYDAYNSPA
jgi:TM2 domain-containing membrane protein YozV